MYPPTSTHRRKIGSRLVCANLSSSARFVTAYSLLKRFVLYKTRACFFFFVPSISYHPSSSVDIIHQPHHSSFATTSERHLPFPNNPRTSQNLPPAPISKCTLRISSPSLPSPSWPWVLPSPQLCPHRTLVRAHCLSWISHVVG